MIGTALQYTKTRSCNRLVHRKLLQVLFQNQYSLSPSTGPSSKGAAITPVFAVVRVVIVVRSLSCTTTPGLD
ncbi:MAG: hypothetical protein CM15mV36_0550 [Caudoviricetes sp.]|nr:MAG: hypothetical protein CM15mV36_0550 [Caudoviricetes sp.]